jgi:hypothetical protein
LILQNCTVITNPSIATEKRQTHNIEKASEQVLIRNGRSKELGDSVVLYVQGGELQQIRKENAIEGNLPKNQNQGVDM